MNSSINNKEVQWVDEKKTREFATYFSQKKKEEKSEKKIINHLNDYWIINHFFSWSKW